MYVNVSITLTEGESAPTETPADMLIALGGDPKKDSINVSVSASHQPPPPDPEVASLAPPVAPTTETSS
jgi:hypothetical protein